MTLDGRLMDDEEKTRGELLAEVWALRRQVDTMVAEQAGEGVGTLRRSGELFAQAFQVNPAAIGITRIRDGRILDINDKFVELTGYQRSEVVGRTSDELGLWADPDDRRRVTQQLVQAGQVLDVDIQFRTKSGATIDGRTSLAFIDLDGDQCVLTMVRDVTERKRAEQVQRFLVEASAVLAASLDYEQTLARFAELVTPLLADWCVVDLLAEDGAIRRLAVAHADAEQRARGWAIARRYPIDLAAPFGPPNVLRCGQPELVPEVSEALLRAVARDDEHYQLLARVGPRSYIVAPLAARGRLLGALTLVMAESGRCYGSADLDLVEDLARRVALAVDNALLYRQTQQALEAREEFLALASHELKTPITSIQVHADLLLRRATREGTTSERDLRAFRALGQQSRRLTRLIQAVLDVSRLQAGRLTLDPRPVALDALAARIVDELAPVAAEHRLVFERAGAGSYLIHGDELRLEQALQNLLQNAVKYSPPQTTVRVSLARDEGGVRLAVADEGIGIPEAARPRLFSRFFRAGNADPMIGGLGVGLYVVHEIVALHGGRVEVESAEGQGSTFTIHLPFEQQEHNPS